MMSTSYPSRPNKANCVQFSSRCRTKRTGRQKRVKETLSDDKKMENECLQNESGGVSMIWSLDPYSLFLQSGLCNVRFLFGGLQGTPNTKLSQPMGGVWVGTGAFHSTPGAETGPRTIGEFGLRGHTMTVDK